MSNPHIGEDMYIMKRKKLLYIMSVDWNWIAQRPHFLALELAKRYDVTVMYPRYLYRPWKGQQNIKAPGRCIGVPQIPFQENSAVLQKISTGIFDRYVGPVQEYDIVWLGTPMFARILPESYQGLVVYDYMDDIAALQPNEKIAAYVRSAHAALLQRADVVTVTSRYLLNGLDETVREKAYLIRNAYRGDVSELRESDADPVYEESKDACWKNRIRLGYVGTISGWMDFTLLLDSLQRFPQIEYHLWGPAGVQIPEHERLIHHGVIEHDRIREAVRDVDCMIMPFQVNDIVLAVDPVKLYEYISFGKNIITVRYPEIERFESYAWLYSGQKEFLSLLERLCKRELPIKYSAKEQTSFLRDNSWEQRGEAVCEILEERGRPLPEKLLTICIPSYNAERYLRKCLDSLTAHSLAEREEILIIDDGSIDHTADIGKEYETMYPGIVQLIRQENRGHGGAVNTGIRHASGLYFQNMDSDDWADCDALEDMIRKIRDSRNLPDVFSSDYHEVSLQTGAISEKRVGRKCPYGKTLSLEEVNRGGGTFTIHSMTIRTSILKGMHVGLQPHTFYVDCEYMMFPAAWIHTVQFRKEKIYQYARDNAGQSVDLENMLRRFDDHTRVLKRLIAFEKKYVMTKGQNAYYESRLKEVLSTHYALCLINDEDRTRGCERAKEFDGWLSNVRPDLARWAGRHILIVRLARQYHFDPVKMEKSVLIRGKDLLAGKVQVRS